MFNSLYPVVQNCKYEHAIALTMMATALTRIHCILVTKITKIGQLEEFKEELTRARQFWRGAKFSLAIYIPELKLRLR